MTQAQAAARLEAATQEYAVARLAFERLGDDLTAEAAREAGIRYENAVAVAQEWAVPDCPKGKA